MTADRMENYDELVENYVELIDDSYEVLQSFSGYMTEAQNTLENRENIDYLMNTLAASGATAPEVVEAKENLDKMVQQLEIEEMNSLDDFIESVLIETEDNEYSFEYQSQSAMMEALIRNQDKLIRVEEQYHKRKSLEADLGNLSFKIAL